MNQQFIQYLHDAEKLQPRFKTYDWAGQLSLLFHSQHEELYMADPAAYDAVYKEASTEVKRVLGITLKDLR